MTIENSTFELSMKYMIDTGYLTSETYIRHQNMFVSEFNFFRYLYNEKDKVRVYELLRSETNVLYRVFFCYHHNLDPKKIKNSTIRDIVELF